VEEKETRRESVCGRGRDKEIERENMCGCK